jgi:hypothetical protein
MLPGGGVGDGTGVGVALGFSVASWFVPIEMPAQPAQKHKVKKTTKQEIRGNLFEFVMQETDLSYSG